MQRNQTSTLAAVAVLTLSLFAGAATTPALAIDDDVDFVCYDTTDSRGNEDLECQTIGDFKAECDFIDPDHVSDECKMLDGETVVIGGILAGPPAPAPLQSLVGDNAADEERSAPTRVRR